VTEPVRTLESPYRHERVGTTAAFGSDELHHGTRKRRTGRGRTGPGDALGAWTAWTEPMAVSRLDETHAVDSASGARCVVDSAEWGCRCPTRLRGETCKQLRRVALETTADRLLHPDDR
jgi:hypothetical protein